MAEYHIHLTWDPDAAVWVATSDDVPGLALENGSFDALIERVRLAVPELLALTEGDDNADVALHFQSQRRDVASAKR